MSIYITGYEADPVLMSGDDIIPFVEQAGQRDAWTTVTKFSALLDTLPVTTGTANGVLYLNASKVATSGSALTFDGSRLSVGAGTALNVAGYNNIVLNGSTGGLLELKSNDTRVLQIQTDGVSAGAQIATVNNGGDPPLIFGVNSTEQMRLTSTGLGIGTSSPTTKLYVTVSAASTACAAFFNTDTANGNGLYVKAGGANSGKYALAVENAAGTSLAYLDSSGNLGLGVTPSAWNSPVKAFQIGSRTSISDAGVFGSTLGNNTYNDALGIDRYIVNGFASGYSQVSGQHRWFTAPSGTAGNAISFTQAMTLDASGNLGIGTTLPFTRTDSASSRSTTLNSIAAFNTMAISATDTTPFAVGVGGGINFRAQLSSTSYSTYAAIWSFRESATISDYKGSLIFGTSDNNDGYPEERARIDSGGNVVIGTAALATNATNGFVYVPGCAGTPTGVPTAFTGRVPIVVDTTNNKLYFYSGGAWRDAGP